MPSTILFVSENLCNHHCPINTRVSLNVAQADLMKKVNVSPNSPLNLISTKYPKFNSDTEKLAA